MPKVKRFAIWINLPTLAVLTAFFCKGVGGDGIAGFTLTVPASLAVQRGRCLPVPCQFTSPMEENFSAYWFMSKEGAEYCFQEPTPRHCVKGLLVATDDHMQQVARSAVGRFYLTGNPQQGSCSFIITDAQLEDEGSYYFRIIGDKGLKFSYSTMFQYTSPHVSVTEAPQVVKIKVDIISSRTPGSSSKKRELGTKFAQEGDTVRLLCTAEGRPDPTLTWWKDGSNISVPQQGGEHAYVIPSATPKDAGNYKCLAQNELGSAMETVQLVVQWLPSRKKELGTKFAQEGDTVRLLCTAEGRPDLTLTWWKDGGNISIPQQGGGHAYEIPLATSKDAGNYKCLAQNELGSAMETVQLVVQFSETPKAFLPADVGILLLVLLGVNKISSCTLVIVLCNCWGLGRLKSPCEKTEDAERKRRRPLRHRDEAQPAALRFEGATSPQPC